MAGVRWITLTNKDANICERYMLSSGQKQGNCDRDRKSYFNNEHNTSILKKMVKVNWT